ncbi:MAG: hypothetical protein LVQ63_01575 [Thermoplasmatales archaeon]|nr:hypothetical protein [Thermoplasmatales archaeon]
MRKDLLYLGIILLVIGVVIAGIAGVEAGGRTEIVGTSLNISPSGVYYSNELTVGSNGSVFVTGNTTTYLIPSQDLNTVNSTNVGNYAIQPTTPSGNSIIYDGLSGTYYLVAFGKHPPLITYAILESNLSQLVVYGLLIIVGAAIAVIGLILAILGAIIRSKFTPVHQF